MVPEDEITYNWEYIMEHVGSFPLFGTSRQTTVDDAYISLAVTSDIEREKYRKREDIAKALQTQSMGGVAIYSRSKRRINPIEALDSTEKGFALLGNAGSGKTTAFRHLAVTLARGRKIRGQKRIPFYLAVRDMPNKTVGVRKECITLLETMEIGEAPRVLDRLLESGHATILLDGLDETEGSHQTELLRELQEIQKRYKAAIVAISGRPYSLAIGLAGFTKWETLPLAPKERKKFVKKWFDAVDPAKGDQLLRKCKRQKGLLDLGSSPLLLSIVCALFWNDLEVPSDPDELYARAIEGLLGGWDAFRAIARSTPLASYPLRRRIVLTNWMAAALFSKNQIVFSARDVRSTGAITRASKAIRGELPDVEDLLRSLYNDFGILVERAPGLYSFSHLTLHEFLVAQYVIDNRTEINLINKHARDEQWFEVIRLVAKMLPKAGKYMSKLSESLDISRAYDAALLAACWKMYPICPPGLRRALVAATARQVVDHLSVVNAKYWVEENCLHITIKSRAGGIILSKSGRTLAQFPLFHSLVDLVNLFRDSGFSPAEMNCENNHLFRVIMHDRRTKIRDLQIHKEGLEY